MTVLKNINIGTHLFDNTHKFTHPRIVLTFNDKNSKEYIKDNSRALSLHLNKTVVGKNGDVGIWYAIPKSIILEIDLLAKILQQNVKKEVLK